ncbi:PREDICTED: uncharacterized protein LOC104822093 isoform X2 [Tarenaya hassleriana]|uniref:uncharacterized protein LOC104822093 isoform X2 n=1 Tax=Tarenaya hassleriana TaxID=28532 RepID=UPI00053C0B92|nr:PREDICTED: uncharacterized protein LOC104822093 isoform X2 [Tarenaya hassleriana]
MVSLTPACVHLALGRSLLAARRSGGLGLGFLEVKQKKKKGSSCSWCGGFLRRCEKGSTGWESEGTKNLEAEILEFMKNSEKPDMFPTKKDLIRSGRSDLVEGILNQGGWLAMGWDMDGEEGRGNEGKLCVRENGSVLDEDLGIEKKPRNDCSQERNGAWSSGNSDVALSLSSSSLSSLEEDAGCESGIEGILSRLEKERNLGLGLSLREKGKSNGAMNDLCHNGPLPESYMKMKKLGELRAFTETESNCSRSLSEEKGKKFLESESLSGMHGLSNSTILESWRTWSMKRAGVSDADFEAAEISPGSLDGGQERLVLDENVGSGDFMKGGERYSSDSGQINQTHIKSRLQHLQAELSSVLRSLRTHTDEAVTSKDREMHSSGSLESLFDDWEFQENEIMSAQDNLRSTRAKLAVLEGKMAMAITDSQRIIREKQRRIDHARRALRLLRDAPIVWPNSASEVLLAGSFDGWSTQRKMEKSKNGVFSLSLKLYPGKYEIKFIVDGQWRVDPLRPIVNHDGHENNLLIIT